MKTFRLIYLPFLLLLFSLPQIQLQDLDPFDMINFDPSTATMKNKEKGKEDKENQSGSLENSMKEETTQETKKKEEATTIPPEYNREDSTTKPTIDITKCPVRVSKSSIFFRQYVRTLLHHLTGKVVEAGGSELDMRLILDFEDIKTLHRYSSSETEVDLHKAHEVLTKMVYMVKLVTPGGISKQRLWVEDKLGISMEKLAHTAIFLAVVFVFVAFLIRLRFSLKQLIVYLFIMIFIISVCLTWVSLYKKEATKQHYAMMNDMPDNCKRREEKDGGFISVTLSWLSSQFTFKEDKCIDYYEMLLIDPLVKVSPVEALAVTATRFFIAPLRHIAEGISGFTRTLLKDLPVQLWPLVLSSMGIFSFLFLFMGFGYRVKLPFGFLTIEPCRPAIVQNQVYQQDLKHVEDVPRNEMLNLKKKQDEMIEMITTLLDNQESSHSQPALTLGEEGSGDASFTKKTKLHMASKLLESPTSSALKTKDPEIKGEITLKNSTSADVEKQSSSDRNVKDNEEKVEEVKKTSVEELSCPRSVPIECTEKVENVTTHVRGSNIPVRRKSTEQPPSVCKTGSGHPTSVSDIGPGDMNGSS